MKNIPQDNQQETRLISRNTTGIKQSNWLLVLIGFVVIVSLIAAIAASNYTDKTAKVIYNFKYTLAVEKSGAVFNEIQNNCVSFNAKHNTLLEVQKAYVEYVGFKDLEAATLDIEYGCKQEQPFKLTFENGVFSKQ